MMAIQSLWIIQFDVIKTADHIIDLGPGALTMIVRTLPLFGPLIADAAKQKGYQRCRTRPWHFFFKAFVSLFLHSLLLMIPAETVKTASAKCQMAR